MVSHVANTFQKMRQVLSFVGHGPHPALVSKSIGVPDRTLRLPLVASSIPSAQEVLYDLDSKGYIDDAVDPRRLTGSPLDGPSCDARLND